VIAVSDALVNTTAYAEGGVTAYAYDNLRQLTSETGFDDEAVTVNAML